MKFRFVFSILFFLTSTLHASEGSLRSVGLETTDSSGCYVTDGKGMVAPTITVMVEAYGKHPRLSNDRILSVIQVASNAGCDMHVTDNVGLTPLNAAILFNEPELVSFLISKGSDPKKIIRSPKQYLNGLNSYQLLELLINKDKATNRDSIHKVLNKKHA